MEKKKVNKMVEITLSSEDWRKHLNEPTQDKYLISSQSGITKEDLDQLSEWARNQIPANRVDSNDDFNE